MSALSNGQPDAGALPPRSARGTFPGRSARCAKIRLAPPAADNVNAGYSIVWRSLNPKKIAFWFTLTSVSHGESAPRHILTHSRVKSASPSSPPRRLPRQNLARLLRITLAALIPADGHVVSGRATMGGTVKRSAPRPLCSGSLRKSPKMPVLRRSLGRRRGYATPDRDLRNGRDERALGNRRYRQS